MNQLKKHLFLGIVCINLSFACSIIAAEKAIKDDFVAFWNQGFCHALEAFGQAKFKELELLEDLIEKQRNEQEAFKVRRAKAEKLLQEAKIQEMSCDMAKRETRLDVSLKLYVVLISQTLTYGEMYKCWKEIKELCEIIMENNDLKETGAKSPYTEFRGWISACTKWSNESPPRYTNPTSRQISPLHHAKLLDPLKALIKKDVTESMELYQKLHGMPHACWDEFNRA
jgi:hypothetical protein